MASIRVDIIDKSEVDVLPLEIAPLIEQQDTDLISPLRLLPKKPRFQSTLPSPGT